MSIKPYNEEDLSEAAIQEMQQEAWLRTFHHASACSPFYREHFHKAGISPRSPVDLSQMSLIPTVDKATVSENSEAFLCVPHAKVVDIVTTSGSTGRPLVWMLTESDMRRLARNEYHSFRCAGLSASDTVVLAVTLDRCFIAGMAYFLGLRELGCSIVRVGPSTPDMHLDLIQRARANVIVGVPSFLGLLSDKAAENRVDLAKLGVRKTICIGEPIRNPDFTLNRAGELIEQRWGARSFSTYGNTELAASLCECSAGCGGHLHPETLHIEAVDESGHPVPDGQPGELTATTFGVEAMPLIRYRTGDFAAIHRQPCKCGRKTIRIGPIIGRKNQKLKVKGVTLFPSTLKVIVDSMPEISSYAIIARRDNPLSDSVEVKIACSGDTTALCHALRDRFQARAKVAPAITAASPAEIDALQMPEGARKRRYFVDFRD